MLAHVFLPSRKGVKRRTYVGRYRFDDMPTPREVNLKTTDKLVALKRLNDLVIRLQREREGLAAPAPMRAALDASFADVVAAYALDLTAQGRNARHIKDTTRRVDRIARECRWKTLGDANAAAFTTWRAKLAPTLSAKHLKEYGVSLRAFFRWLIQTERFDRNPFAHVKHPDTRGKETRVRRAFTPEEAARLLAVADYRRLPYLTLLYTGLRYREAWGLRWADYRRTPDGPCIVLPAGKTKGKRERVIPLRAELAAELDAHRLDHPKATPASRIFAGIFPRQRTDKRRPNSLRVDMAKAGIPVRDELGRVIDFHSFRKTFNTWAAVAGVPLRAAQSLLGHSTPDLTAGPYTDERALGLAGETAKLPWVGGPFAAESNAPAQSGRINGEALSRIAESTLKHILALVDATGLEPVTPSV